MTPRLYIFAKAPRLGKARKCKNPFASLLLSVSVATQEETETQRENKKNAKGVLRPRKDCDSETSERARKWSKQRYYYTGS